MLNHYIPFSIVQLFKSLKGPIVSLTTLSVIYILVYFKLIELNAWLVLALMLIVAISILYIFDKKAVFGILKVLKEKRK